MTRTFDFTQIDVFTDTPLQGNPLAVVHDADALDAGQMQAFANWMNLSETAFLLAPTTPDADYRVRIFTTSRELPFAGHPTLGSCHAWLAARGSQHAGDVVQECGVGLVPIRRAAGRLAFAAPPLRRSGPVDAGLLARIARALRVAPGAIRASQWVDNGPGWVAVMLGSRAEVLALEPDFAAMQGLEVGVIAPWLDDAAEPPAQFEVRAFVPSLGAAEDPVTGSLNAGLSQWLIGAGLAPPHYIASQGTVLGRAGRVHVDRIGDDIWIGGATVVCVDGRVSL
jgi:PhzF family phenazine biosynthesis protein